MKVLISGAAGWERRAGSDDVECRRPEVPQNRKRLLLETPPDRWRACCEITRSEHFSSAESVQKLSDNFRRWENFDLDFVNVILL